MNLVRCLFFLVCLWLELCKKIVQCMPALFSKARQISWKHDECILVNMLVTNLIQFFMKLISLNNKFNFITLIVKWTTLLNLSELTNQVYNKLYSLVPDALLLPGNIIDDTYNWIFLQFSINISLVALNALPVIYSLYTSSDFVLPLPVDYEPLHIFGGWILCDVGWLWNRTVGLWGFVPRSLKMTRWFHQTSTGQETEGNNKS